MTLRIAIAIAIVGSATSVQADDTSPAPSAAEPAPPSPPSSPPCDDPGTDTRLASLVHARRFADVHHAAVGLRVLCGSHGSERWRLLDDVALLRLDDRAWAIQDLEDLARGPRGDLARTILAWAYVTDHDRESAGVVLARLPEPKAAAILALGSLDDRDAFAAATGKLEEHQRAAARELERRYHDARPKHPALAGVLSALLPGSGQLYAGSIQAAAITFVLNGLFIGATVELARRHDYITAAAAGTTASFFYVGGIMNAVDLARRRNQIEMQPYADQLEAVLVPELDGAL